MVSESAVKAVFEKSLKLKSRESCLVVSDTAKEALARPFYEYASRVTKKTRFEVIAPRGEHGVEPPPEVASEMLDYDVILLITAKSLSHTKARREATRRGARIASMPAITEEIMNRCLDVDYKRLEEDSRAIYKVLSRAKAVRVSTGLGTDFEAKLGKTPIYGERGGTLDYKGAFGNLPEGEVCFWPQDSNGVYMVDASFPELGRLKSPLTFKVRDNRVYEISGDRAAEVKRRLDAVGEKAYLIAELGIGTNPKAIITGNVLEDEKAAGAVHVALGNNLSFGGDNDAPLHLDGVIAKPRVFVDGKEITESLAAGHGKS
jgi:leucyl aminopeptidase (aminopeptidase T)